MIEALYWYAFPAYRKIGGMHWLRLGRLRVAICWVKR